MQSANPQAEVTSKITVEITSEADIIHKTPGLYSSSTHHKHPPKLTYFAMTTHDRNPINIGIFHSWCDRKLHHKPQSFMVVEWKKFIFKLICCSKNRFNDPCNGKSLIEFLLQNEAIQNSSNFINLNLGLGLLGGSGLHGWSESFTDHRDHARRVEQISLSSCPTGTAGALFLDFTCTLVLRVFWKIPGLKLLFPQISCKWKMGTSKTVFFV